MIKWFFNWGKKAKPLTFWAIIRRLVTLLLLWVVLYQLWIFLHISWLIKFNPSSTAFMSNRLAVMQLEKPDAKLKYKWVDYSKISTHVKRAVLAGEDTKFLQHAGFDWEGIEHAFKRNLKKRKLVAGGSTVTQQLAKNLFLSSARTPWRKAEEAFIAFMLEKMLSKKRILEVYLNVIEWGNGVFGIEAAARHYYQTSAKYVSSYQAAKLAAMIPNPRYYDKHRNTRFLNRHTATINARMRHVRIP